MLFPFSRSCLSLEIKCSSGSSCCKSEIFNPEERCTWHNTRNSWKIGGTSEGRGSVHGAQIMFLVLWLLFGLPRSVFLILSLQVTANMRGSSAEEVAERILSQTSFPGLQVSFEMKAFSPVPSIFSPFLSFFAQISNVVKNKTLSFLIVPYKLISISRLINLFTVACTGSYCESRLL